jgi:hypothetical protein
MPDDLILPRSILYEGLQPPVDSDMPMFTYIFHQLNLTLNILVRII